MPENTGDSSYRYLVVEHGHVATSRLSVSCATNLRVTLSAQNETSASKIIPLDGIRKNEQASVM